MVDKCNTCMRRYPCDEMTEWECKRNRYRHYDPDTSKIAELEGRTPTIGQESSHQKGQKENNMKELKETIDLMTSADYKERFRAEYWQLMIRAEKLFNMIDKYRAGTLDFAPACPLKLLEAQLDHMLMYLGALEIRARFENVRLEG